MRLSESTISRGLPTFLGMMFACLNPLNAQSTQGVPRDILSPEAQLSLAGDALPTMILPLWETVLNNLDGYQNNNSIAVSGGTVYVCVNHIDPIETGEERSTIFIRRFDANNGSELQPWLLECPDRFRPFKKETNQTSGVTSFVRQDVNNFVITNDESGNLMLVTILGKTDNYKSAVIYMVPLSQDGQLLSDSACEADLQLGFDNFTDKNEDACLLTKVDRVEGDISSGNYRVGLLPVWKYVPFNANYFDYAEVTVTTDDENEVASSVVLSRVNFERNHETGAWGNISRPEIHFVAGQSRYAVVTTTQAADLKGSGAPMLYRGTGAGNDIIFVGRETFPGNPTAQRECRGFYTFRHGDHTMAVYPQHFDETNGAQFSVTEWPDVSTLSSMGDAYVSIPSKPFSRPAKVAPAYYRQLITSRKVDNDQLSGWHRPAGDDTPVTDLFVSTPGSGIAAFRVTPSDHMTALSDVLYSTHDASRRLRLEGNVLYVDGDTEDSGDRLVITDINGRAIYSAVPASSQISLDRFPAGLYIAAYGDARLKIALK